jgi:hypothetical protein
MKIANKFREKYAEVISDPKLTQLSLLKSFAAKIKFCNENFQKIRAGSGRIAYHYSPTLILKLARNSRGIAQNNVENDNFIQQHYKDLIAQVKDSAPDDSWMIFEKAERISPGSFKAAKGFSLSELKQYLLYVQKGIRGNIDPKLIDKLDEDLWVQELRDMIGNFDMNVGDIDRASTWGKVNNKIVIIDYGLTNQNFNEFYR